VTTLAVVRRIAAGNAAEVYECRDEDSGARVAAKILSPAVVAVRPYVPEAFANEIEVLRSLGPTSRVIEAIAYGDRFSDDLPHPYLVTPLFEGDASALILANAPGLTAVLRDALDGLAEMHARGFLHRDIKAENIVVTGDGRGFICDLDRARPAVTEHDRRPTYVFGDSRFAALDTLILRENATTIERISAEAYGVVALVVEFLSGVALTSVCLAHPVKTQDRAKDRSDRERRALFRELRPPFRTDATRFVETIVSGEVRTALLAGLIDSRDGWGTDELAAWTRKLSAYLPESPFTGLHSAAVINVQPERITGTPHFLTRARSACVRYPDSPIAWMRRAQAEAAGPAVERAAECAERALHLARNRPAMHDVLRAACAPIFSP
jgi:serine/threonine protein kinase